ncbi:hypothetical protein M426DRAFT_9889 [Hypoxylon sp. CI-4A]|nr:hypothetical protein M426DRAFT_9889 [Hypoxylon sp. CI-4A]
MASKATSLSSWASASLAESYTSRCPKCNATFISDQALQRHQTLKAHHLCDTCNLGFHSRETLLEHQNHDHRADQNLICPGCQKKFNTAGGWVAHVEDGQCVLFSSSQLAEGVAEIMEDIMTSLRAATVQQNTAFEPTALTHITDIWGEDWKAQISLDAQENPDAFPELVNNGSTPGGSTQASSPIPPVRATKERVINPDDDSFNATVFLDPILELFKCPHKNCKSKLKTAGGLVSHLKSAAHKAKPFLCPNCRRTFTSATAWISHAELVPSSRCGIRETEIYGYAVNVLTNGALLVDSENKLPNGTPRVWMNENWADRDEWVKAKPQALRAMPGAAKTVPDEELW